MVMADAHWLWSAARAGSNLSTNPLGPFNPDRKEYMCFISICIWILKLGLLVHQDLVPLRMSSHCLSSALALGVYNTIWFPRGGEDRRIDAFKHLVNTITESWAVLGYVVPQPVTDLIPSLWFTTSLQLATQGWEFKIIRHQQKAKSHVFFLLLSSTS